MSEAHPDADLVKVTRTTTTYEPAETKSQPPAVRSRNRTMLWVVGAVVFAVLVLGALYYASTLNTPAATQQSAAVASQQNAQTLSQQATTAQQAADQSAAQTKTLSATAATDRDAARSASVGAADSRDAAATTNSRDAAATAK
jgi:cytoskeletal protein RodZ